MKRILFVDESEDKRLFLQEEWSEKGHKVVIPNDYCDQLSCYFREGCLTLPKS